jgi:hypothetical protein
MLIQKILIKITQKIKKRSQAVCSRLATTKPNVQAQVKTDLRCTVMNVNN